MLSGNKMRINPKTMVRDINAIIRQQVDAVVNAHPELLKQGNQETSKK